MLTNSTFYGDDPSYGIGVVEDVNDPAQTGRVRVRIFGLHTPDLNDLPTDDLPWSQVLTPITSASISGIGQSPTGIENGSQVYGVFLDGKRDKQQFLVLGTMPGKSYQTNIQKQLAQNKITTDNIENVNANTFAANSNGEKVFTYFISQGYSEEQAAGITGSLAFTSGDSFNTNQSGGIGKLSAEEFKQYKEYAASKNKPVNDLNTQLEWINKKIQSNPSAKKDLKNAKNSNDAANIFSRDILGDNSTLITRQRKAKEIKSAFGTSLGSTGNFEPVSVPDKSYSLGDIIESEDELLSYLTSAKRQVTEIIVHHTDTYENQTAIDVYDIDQWHKSRTPPFSEIGYHFLILSNGELQIGRNVNKIGAHAKTGGHNNYSIGIAFVGGIEGSSKQAGKKRSANTFSLLQWKTFDKFCKACIKRWPDINFLGHRDTDPGRRTDPEFDVADYVKSRFGQENTSDVTPRDPAALEKTESPTPSTDSFETPSATTTPELTDPVPDAEVTVITETGESTVPPGGLSDIIDTTLFLTSLAGQVLANIGNISNTAPTNGQVLTYNSATQKWEPSTVAGGGGLYSVSDTIAAIASNDYLSFIDVGDSNNPKRILVSSFLTDNAIATASSTTTFTNKSGAISQWTNDSGYTTNAGTVTSVAVSGTDGIEVDSGSPITTSGTITLGLSSAVLTSLGLADSALQSGDAVSDLTNDAGYITSSALIGYLQNLSEDASPQLGGSLDVNENKIVSVSNGNIDIEPHGTGNVLLGNFTFDADQTVGAGQDNYVLTYDNATGLISLEAAAGGGSGDVSKVGTPVNDQIGVWTGDGTIEGDANFIWSGANESLGIGRTPTAGSGTLIGKLQLEGAASDIGGPHLMGYLDSDTTYPIYQLLGWTSDNISINFGAFWNGSGWISSDAGTNFQLTKNSDAFRLNYDAGVSVGSGVTWNTGLLINSSGQVACGELFPASQTTGHFNDGVGNYGSVSVTGIEGSSGTYEGYSINGRVVFMNNGSTTSGFYNDTDNEWHMTMTQNAGVNLYYNGSGKLVTTNTGVSVTGALSATGEVTAYSSDARLKTNIETIISPLEKISKMRGVTYDWDRVKCFEAGFEYVYEHEHGVIAQEIEQVMPDVVVPAPFDNNYKTVRYDKIVPILIESIKALHDEINILKGQIS